MGEVIHIQDHPLGIAQGERRRAELLWQALLAAEQDVATNPCERTWQALRETQFWWTWSRERR